MSKAETETDTYYAVEWLSKKAPNEGWNLVADSYEDTKRCSTVEKAMEEIQNQKATFAAFGFGGINVYRVVKITETVTKEVIE